KSMPKSGTTAPPRKSSPKSAPAASATKTSSKRPTPPPAPTPPPPPPPTPPPITDSRTTHTYSITISHSAIRAPDLKKIKTDDPNDLGLVSYDPAFLNTAACRSAITFIDGDKGILRYRGYPIEQLAENATFLEVAWLLRHGELPDQKQYDQFV